MNSVVETIDL